MPSNALLFLILTVFISFISPIMLIGAMMASLVLLGYIPVAEGLATVGIDAIVQFLATFGSGCPLSGLFAIGLTCAFVGGLFQIYNHYRYQH
ncbi:hypothetical protein [Oscillatoria sp. FACHB-1406]|uniref:hypothetical protein n=1 Tax=Oscillatoria sp. FACHB-1406 TaxID=2692846 RepID=UPI0018EF8C15|nr:hypothetical protein [Oscillatoria sp. FACHB-1406]